MKKMKKIMKMSKMDKHLSLDRKDRINLKQGAANVISSYKPKLKKKKKK